MYIYTFLKWDLSNLDTNGAEESVVVSEVSSFQRLKTHARVVLGMGKGVLFRERCPQFRGVLIEEKSQEKPVGLHYTFTVSSPNISCR